MISMTDCPTRPPSAFRAAALGSSIAASPWLAEMFERYTHRARRVIFFARYEASALTSPAINTEHLLLALLRESGGASGVIFRRRQLSYEAVRMELAALAVPGEPAATSVDMPLSTEAKRVLQDAADEADRVKAPYIDAEHLLLGLLRQSDCPAAEILNSKGLGLEAVREETRPGSLAKEATARPSEAFPKLADFLQRIEDQRAAYHVSPFRRGAIRVEVGLPDEKWVVTFFADGRVAVEVFSESGRVELEPVLDRLLDRLGPPPKNEA